MSDGPFIKPAADKIDGIKYPIVKLAYGDAGSYTLVSETNPLPTGGGGGGGGAVKVEGDPINYQPGYHPASEGGGNVKTDPSGNLVTRAQILTDEGSFRANFSGTSLGVTIGTCTFTNGSATVSGTALDTYDLHFGDYVKLDADGESAWCQIDSVDSPTQLTLVENYTGAGGTGASSCVIVKPITGSGASITVGSGVVTIACGTTATAVSEVERDVDYGPLLFQSGVSVSQRIANQDIYIGLYDAEHASTPYYYAWFRINGTTATTVICESGAKRDGMPSGAEIETTTVTIPNGQSTLTSRRYRIEVLLAKLRFYIDGILVAEHYKSMPRPMDKLTATIRCVNGTTPATNTNVISDYITTKNFNTVDITIPGEMEGVIANTAALETMSYSQAGVIAINTDLMIRDCSQCRSIMVQCTSMGTTGVVTPAWSNDGVNWVTATGFSEAGASSTTFNAAALRYYNVLGRYFRLRLTTATTGGTTTIYSQCSQQPIQQWLATQPVSGTVTSAGAAAHDAAISGNPTRIAGRALTANYTTVATGDTADLVTTLVGALVGKQYSIPELDIVVNDRIANSATAVQVKALTASNKQYVTGLTIKTATLGGASDFLLRSTPVASTTATIASNTLVMSATYNWKVGDLVYVTASTVTGLTAGNYYYILTVSAANLTFSATRGGSTLAISGTTVSATLSKVLFRVGLETTPALISVPFVNPADTGTGLALEAVTLTAVTGNIDFSVSGYTAP